MNPQFSAPNIPPGGIPGPFNQERKPYNGFESYSDGYGAPPSMSSGKPISHPQYMSSQNGSSPRPPMDSSGSNMLQYNPNMPPQSSDQQIVQRSGDVNMSQQAMAGPPPPSYPGGQRPHMPQPTTGQQLQRPNKPIMSHVQQQRPPHPGSMPPGQIRPPLGTQQPHPPVPQFRTNEPPGPQFRTSEPPGPQFRSNEPPPGLQFRTNEPPAPGAQFRSNEPPGQTFRSNEPPGPTFRPNEPLVSQFRSNEPPGPQFRFNEPPPGPTYRSNEPPGPQFRSNEPPTLTPSSMTYQNDLGPQYSQPGHPMHPGQVDMSQNGPYYPSGDTGMQTNYVDQANGPMSLGMQQTYSPPMPSRYPAPPPMSGMNQAQYPPPGGMGNGQKRMTAPPGQPPAQAQRRLDPDNMPSPIQVIEEDKKNHTEVFSTSVRGQVPPLVTTDYVASDGGICIPRFMRSTIYTVPTTAEILKQTCVPFAIALTPFAKPHDGENVLPLSNLGESGPVRCNRCKAYMCPFMQFIDGGRRFQCIFCKATTEVPPEYFAHLDHMGERVDKYQRPELCLGSYEFVATKEYCKNSVFPNCPAFIFIIDVSYNSVRSGMLRLLCDNMNAILHNIPKEQEDSKPKIKVGFITYSNVVHFFNIKSDLAQPQMMVVSDVQDMFVPILEGFLVDYHESQMVIDSLLQQIPDMFAETRETETVLGPAIQAGLEAVKAAECSGKLFVFHTTLPLFEAPGKLRNRDDRKLLGTEKEKTVLCPQTSFYNNLGQECVAAGCCVDLFLFPNAYIDVATLGQVCRLTGGEMFKYTFFQADIDGARFLEDLKRNVSKPIAFDAIIRVRTSTGIRPTEFWGNFFMSNTTDIEVAAIDCDKTIAVEIKYDDKLGEEDGAFIQAAVLYTSCGGQRRLRIHNLALNTGTQMGDMFRTCELDTILNVFSKEAVRMITEQTPQHVKNHFICRSAQILACYRKHCANRSAIGQLILPECMKLLPLYVNCLVKSDAISGGQEMSIDDRSYIMLMVNSMNVEASACYLYPRLLPMNEIDTETDELPIAMRCSIEKIKEDAVYLIENGLNMFLWVGMSANPEWLQDVFAISSAAVIDVDKTALVELNTPTSKRVRAIVQQIQQERQRHMRLFIVRQGDKLELLFRQLLVEDRTTEGSSSYVDFLCHLHKEIRNLLT